MVHGGYHWSFHEEFFGYVERAIREGYVVIFPEYRGSRGYGAEHYKAQEYGGKDVADVLSAADYLAWSRPYVDAERLGSSARSRAYSDAARDRARAEAFPGRCPRRGPGRFPRLHGLQA